MAKRRSSSCCSASQIDWNWSLEITHSTTLQDPETLDLLVTGPARVSRLNNILREIVERIHPSKILDEQAAENIKTMLKQNLSDEKEVYRVGRQIEDLVDWPCESELGLVASHPVVDSEHNADCLTLPRGQGGGGCAQRPRALVSKVHDATANSNSEQRGAHTTEKGRECFKCGKSHAGQGYQHCTKCERCFHWRIGCEHLASRRATGSQSRDGFITGGCRVKPVHSLTNGKAKERDDRFVNDTGQQHADPNSNRGFATSISSAQSPILSPPSLPSTPIKSVWNGAPSAGVAPKGSVSSSVLLHSGSCNGGGGAGNAPPGSQATGSSRQPHLVAPPLSVAVDTGARAARNVEVSRDTESGGSIDGFGAGSAGLSLAGRGLSGGIRALGGGGSGDAEIKFHGKSIKLALEGKRYRFIAESWRHLKQQIDSKGRIRSRPYEITYKDQDGDDINLDCEDEFRFAVRHVGDKDLLVTARDS